MGPSSLQVYLGPAALCPPPDPDQPFLVISGDQEDWATALIRQRCHWNDREQGLTVVRHGVIAKPGAKKFWYQFDQPFLNGIFASGLFSWCNQACDCQLEKQVVIQAHRLDQLIAQSGLQSDSRAVLMLTIAQGDPLLTLKRSESLLARIAKLDFSLHPLGLLWQQSLQAFLRPRGFVPTTTNASVWINTSMAQGVSASPWAEPSESEAFLDPSLRLLLRLFPVDAYRAKHPEAQSQSDLQLLRRLITEPGPDSLDLSLGVMVRDQLRQRFLPRRSHPGPAVQRAETSDPMASNPDQPPSRSPRPRSSIRGHVDGFQDDLSLRGWVDASSFGSASSTVRVTWQERDDLLIGEGVATQARPDLIEAGLTALDCGFSVDLSFGQGESLLDLLDVPVTLRLVESKSGELIGGAPWPLSDAVKTTLLPGFVSAQIANRQDSSLQAYLAASTSSTFLSAIRYRLLEHSILSCFAGNWNDLPLRLVVNAYASNDLLDYGVPSESARRIELVFMALRHLLSTIDHDQLHKIDNSFGQDDCAQLDVHSLVEQLRERCFLGLQPRENRLWQTALRPLFDVLIGTFFLQQRPKPLAESRDLLDALARIAEGVYADLPLATYLRSILEIDHSYGLDQRHADLAFQAGDCFTYLMAVYSRSRGRDALTIDLRYCASVVGFVDKSPALLTVLTGHFRTLLPQYLADHPRQSKPRHWLDNLGFLVNASTQHLVMLMLESGVGGALVRHFHEAMIGVKKDLAELLWVQPAVAGLDRPSQEQSSGHGARRWLIIGEPDLHQCWLYRVEQKFAQLSSLGAEVRCLDHHQLKAWSFSHHVQWADAVVICRLAATYPVLRAMAFARHCGKQVFAEIDDLIFTSDYPAPYASYGGSISRQQFRNLSIDYPLRQAVLRYADDVIVSTDVLADVCQRALGLDQNRIHVLPNLPLKPLEDVASALASSGFKSVGSHRIVVSSGTLSHKQIFNDQIVPLLSTVLERFSDVSLTIIGYFEVQGLLARYADRISVYPFSDYQTYLDVLQSASIALVPLEVHPTTHAKSAIKWMEASLCGVVSICSPVRAYTDVINHGKNGLIAETREQWLDAIERLLADADVYASMRDQAFTDARHLFGSQRADAVWSRWLPSASSELPDRRPRQKVLVINVFFAPQSIGGATRVAQDYVDDLLNDPDVDYDVTVLCTDYDHWQSDPPELTPPLDQPVGLSAHHKTQSLTTTGSSREAVAHLRGQMVEQGSDYRDEIGLDLSFWKGVRVVRLCLPPKPWSKYHDPLIEQFCEDFFAVEAFDRIQCHCCQLLTASPLEVARRQGIPYEIVLHDAWWMSVEQFLVTPSGSLVDPADPLGHFDHDPTAEEQATALERRGVLYQILASADRRIAVSSSFQALCESAGIANVDVQENRFASMAVPSAESSVTPELSEVGTSIRVCHIGGMSLHKGYQLMRRAVHALPPGLGLVFTVVDHRLASRIEHYTATWNGYDVRFIAPIPMAMMSQFYASQDVLIAPSIWPESFGLVTREALSAGLWVIASEAGALADPIRDSAAPVGTIVPPNDLDALVAAIAGLRQS